ncbi:MAG: pteridine reductase [Chromatiales bacterium]|nr:pteridine reductase [Chromatiales bacterium]
MRERRSLDGQWALITGAGKRIGATTARVLHQAGASVAIHYRGSAAGANALAEELNALRPGSAIVLQADLLQVDALRVMVERMTEHTGRLDILVNNASSFYPTPLGEVTERDWEDLVGSNLKAPLFLSQAALPHLRRARGCIVNIVDIHATRPLRDHPVYGPAKAGLAMLTRSLARDLAPEIRVNGVSPGAILWPEDGMSEKAQASILRQVPLARTGEPEDIAECVLYLVRDAVYVTGQVIAVDGGRSAGW